MLFEINVVLLKPTRVQKQRLLNATFEFETSKYRLEEIQMRKRNCMQHATLSICKTLLKTQKIDLQSTGRHKL